VPMVFELGSSPIVYGQQFALAWQANSSVGLADDGTAFKTNFTTNTFGTMPSTISIHSGSTGGTGIISIYASGSLSAGAAGKPIGGPARTQMHYR